MRAVVAVNGGVLLCDILSGRVPQPFQPGTLYAVAGAAGCGAFMLLLAASVDENLAAALGVAATFGLRIAAVRFGWQSQSAKAMNQRLGSLAERRRPRKPSEPPS